MKFYCSRVEFSLCYSSAGPMNALSMVGAKQEECGQHFKDILKMLEDSPILKPIMPWGQFNSNLIRVLIYIAMDIF